MLKIFSILIICLTWTFGQAQVANASFDDLCVGCCGLKFHFDSSGSFWCEEGGYASKLRFGKWTFEQDTLHVQYDHDTSNIDHFVFIDSLTIRTVGSSWKTSLKKVSHNPRDNIYIKYEYEPDELVSRKTYKLGILVNWRDYKGNLIIEKNFSDQGILQSNGTWKKDKRKGEWFFYSVNGELIETKEF